MKIIYDATQGKNVYAYTIKSGGLEADICEVGARINAIRVNGVDVVFGFKSVSDYVKSDCYAGATIGRVANRIAKGGFELNGKRYALNVNNGENHLHGGNEGFDKKKFTVTHESDDSVTMEYLSADGEENYPGNLKFTVTFKIENSALIIEYGAVSDADTLWCPTNHAYFNLDGEQNGDCRGNMLKINADYYTPVDGGLIPTGEKRGVKGTPFDFTRLKAIGKHIGDKSLAASLGYDHNYVLNGEHAAHAEGKATGIKMDVYTDMPCLQFYSGGQLKGIAGKSGFYNKFGGFCLEPQFCPDAINNPAFEQPVLKKGEEKRHFIRFAFAWKEENREGNIPVIVGVTGHRDLVEGDKQLLGAEVKKSLAQIKELCHGKKKGKGHTPVIMLNAFAQGADMLCAEAAFGLGMDVYAVLPCAIDKYKKSFDVHLQAAKRNANATAQDIAEAEAKDAADREKLDYFLSRAKKIIYAPDTEKNREWLARKANTDEESYEYRQLGIYMAEYSHILLALWDGKQPKTDYGCGTVEVIKFALEHKFLDRDKLFKPGLINDTAVVWIKTRRQSGDDKADINRKWLTSCLTGDEGERYQDYLLLDITDEILNPPAFLKNIISKTAKYNSEKIKTDDNAVRLWKDADGLDGYRKNLRRHYVKADGLSCFNNGKRYVPFIKSLAVIGALLVFAFLIYDDASCPYAMFACTAALILMLCLVLCGNKKNYHKKFVEYRAFAEALRIQFYTSLCISDISGFNVCHLYAWSQKVDMVWIEKAIQSLEVIGGKENINADVSQVIEVWIGNNTKPTGQLNYHTSKRKPNDKRAKLCGTLSVTLKIAAVVIYLFISALEIVALVKRAQNVDWFWEHAIFYSLSYRNFTAILLGTVSALSLLLAGGLGKMAYGRKAEDNKKMIKFYASAYERWKEVKGYSQAETEAFVKEVAREEILENGVWCSYVSENGLDMTI